MKFTNAEYVAELRAVADWFEAHPDLPLGHILSDIHISALTREEIARVAKCVGHADKVYGDDFFWLNVDATLNTRISFFTERENVCERVQTGTKVIPAHIEEVPEREVPVYEWRCPGSLLAESEVA